MEEAAAHFTELGALSEAMLAAGFKLQSDALAEARTLHDVCERVAKVTREGLHSRGRTFGGVQKARKAYKAAQRRVLG